MGTTSSGRFGEYHPEAGPDKCSLDPGPVELEDVAQSQWSLSNSGAVPAKGTLVNLGKALQGGRLVIEDTLSGLTIGLVPIKFNYLYQCMSKGLAYEGDVTGSLTTPVHSVTVHLKKC